MSEDEQFEDSEQYEDEQDDRELITWVKANSFLYNKSEKLYSNNEVKNSAWDAIGNNLTNKKTGPEAEHRFFQLRQRFGRERKKVIQSQPRSGAGTSQPTYSSKWILYNDLMFLADVIKHRKTTTNYKRIHPKSQAIQVPKSQAIQQVNLPTSLNLASKSNSSSSLWNEELSINSPDDVPEYSNMSDNESLSALQTSQSSPQSVGRSSFADSLNMPDNESLAALQIPQSSSQSVGRSSFAVSDSSRIASLKKIQAITREKRVPELDSFAKRKKQDMDKFNQSISKQSQSLTALAQKVESAISVHTTPSEPQVTDSLNSLRPDIRAMLSVIAFSLQKLSESKQLDFLITIIQLLKQHTEGDATTQDG
ncbi:uncharacterized protein LOC112458412 [Temnothorax curvispinosus]|uniref:Uncharacterized protein LOC112458412 n=1 Tax=Temnothorax curvispinosus TaxID=300111 RepID=A0A6J1Q7Z3_9HYME|nr:uncharacterized protein LOC112458412 [Temnothorax curvispinosus]